MKQRTTEFDEFWAVYPRRVGKLAALQAFKKARRVGTLAEILVGVANYCRHKPTYADYCHPSTWLNQGRWMDEYEQAATSVHRKECPHTPKCHSPVWCDVVTAREQGVA